MFLKKINKGAILAGLIVLIIAAYHTIIFALQMQDKNDITAFLTDYYKTVSRISVLDSKYHDFDVNVPEELVNEKADAYTRDIAEFFIKDNVLLEGNKTAYKGLLEYQAEYERTKSQTLKNIKILNFEKKDNKMNVAVSVTFDKRFMRKGFATNDGNRDHVSEMKGESIMSDTLTFDVSDDGKLLISKGGNGFFNHSYVYSYDYVKD